MRRSLPRTLIAVLMVFLPIFSVFINGQDQSSKNPTVAETELLTTGEGPAARVTDPLTRGLRIPGLLNPVAADPQTAERPRFRVMTHPREGRLVRGHSFRGDLRNLPQISPQKFERPEFEAPVTTPVLFPGTQPAAPRSMEMGRTSSASPSAPAP